jgi:uncharacterized protein YutD
LFGPISGYYLFAMSELALMSDYSREYSTHGCMHMNNDDVNEELFIQLKAIHRQMVNCVAGIERKNFPQLFEYIKNYCEHTMARFEISVRQYSEWGEGVKHEYCILEVNYACEVEGGGMPPLSASSQFKADVYGDGTLGPVKCTFQPHQLSQF